MRSKKACEDVVSLIYNYIVADCAVLEEVRKAELEAVKSTNTEEAENAISALNTAVVRVTNGVGAKVENFIVPGFLNSVRLFDAPQGGVSSVILTVKSRLNAQHPYKSQVRIECDSDDFLKDLVKGYANAICNMCYITMAQENLDEVNRVMAGFVADLNLPYTFSFVLDTDGVDAPVRYIDDTTVQFNVSVENALNASAIQVFDDSEGYMGYCTDLAIENFKKAIAPVSTTVELIRANIDAFIALVPGLKTRKRADKILRMTYHKKAEFLSGKKVAIGYVEVNDAFALVEKNGEDYRVVLSPFSVKTMERVDMDVLTAAALA